MKRKPFSTFHLRKPVTVLFCLLLLVMSTLFPSGCINMDPVEKAVEVIDKGISDITQNSEDWQTILQRVANDLPKKISETIRTDAQNLASRAVATTGVEFRCNVDFLGNRAIQALNRLKALLLNQNPPPLPPAFCQVVPASIDLKVDPGSWSTTNFYGYDLDNKDTSGNKLKVLLINNQGNVTTLSEDRIGRTTHYQVTLNLGNMARDFYVNKINKLVVSWNNSSEGYPQIVVIPWEAQTKIETKNINATGPYYPPKTEGDADFDTSDEDYTSVTVSGEIKILPTKIQTRVSMYARESVPDHTTVNGSSAWSDVYQSPSGWQIIDVTPKSNSTHNAKVTTHGTLRFDRPGGEIVYYFSAKVDSDGDEAGTWTSVTAYWRSITVTLKETIPSWLQ
jgi:hypothetical protein